MKTFVQKSKVGVAGSFFNQLMSNNSSIPEVGKGATQMHYTDRTCYEVIKVSKDCKTAKLEILSAKAGEGKNEFGHQNWVLEPTGQFITVVWRYNAWYQKGKCVGFTKAFEKKHEGVSSYALQLTKEQREAIYAGDVTPQNVVEGITEQKNVYSKIKILFGSKDYYYDWTF